MAKKWAANNDRFVNYNRMTERSLRCAMINRTMLCKATVFLYSVDKKSPPGTDTVVKAMSKINDISHFKDKEENTEVLQAPVRCSFLQGRP